MSLDPIFSPRSIAVIGASREKGSIGFALLHNLVMQEFNGTIFPVNPHANVIHSLKAYPHVSAVPDDVDLAVVMVPSRIVPQVVDECLEKGVRGFVVITAGFGETGEAGAAVERRICEAVRAAGVRMIGPNCMGVINTDPEVRLDATFAPVPARRGSVGFVSQSGALGVAILTAAKELGIGLTQFVSMGNKADVSGNDMLEYWEDDEATRVIAMYLESFGNPRRFTEIAKRVARKKPILVVKSGRTAEGARAATSHTGAIAGPDVTVSAFLAQCGVLRANTIAELFDIAQALDRCPLPAGDRVAIVTNAGGPAIMATDACVNMGLSVPELSPETGSSLARYLPAEASLRNPVDMIASASPDDYRRTLELLLADPVVDQAIVINVTPLLTNPIDVMDAVHEVARDSSKPVVAVMMAKEEFYEEVRRRPDLPPVYRFPESAARALSSLSRYSAWRRRPLESETPEFAVDDALVASLLGEVESGYLSERAAFAVLDAYGIPTARYRSASSIDELLAAAKELGYPVALKALAPGLIHKSEAGAVRVGIADDQALRQEAQAMRSSVAAAGFELEELLVQEMAGKGHEVIFGISTDPRFGPLLMFGLGGKYVEVFQDVRFGVTPLSPTEASDMIRGIRGFALLEGVRGEAGADLEVLEEVLLRVAQLAHRHPRIRELDINPFIAAPDKASAVAVDARIRVGD